MLALFAVFTSLPIELHLKITDLEGQRITAVKQGAPFLIEITVLGEGNPGESASGEPTLGEPTLTHMSELAACQRYPVATHITIINGQQHTQRRYLYKARIDARGQHALGPAYFDFGTHVVRSEALSFIVEPNNNPAAPNQALTDPFIIAKTNKTSIYAGEQVVLTVRLCYKKPVDSFALEPVTISHATVQQLGNPVQESFSYDGHSWSSFLYTFLVYPQQAGELVIPALQANGVREKDSTAGSFFARFFGSFEREKIRATTTPVVLTVKPLPAGVQAHAVGDFVAFTASLDKKNLNLTTAATLTLTLVGTGDTNTITFNSLPLPAAFKRYDAKRTITRDEQRPGFLVLRQEMVLQPLAAGDFVLAPFVFSFFDPKSGTVKQLKTMPLSLHVSPSAAPVSDESVPTILSHQKKRPWPKIPTGILVGVSMLVVLILSAHYVILRYRAVIIKKIIFYRFRRLLKRVRSSGDAHLIYRAWFDVLKHLMGAHALPTSLREIEHVVGDNLRFKWRTYVTQLEKYAFEFEELPVDLDDLVEQTAEWINEFEELL